MKHPRNHLVTVASSPTPRRGVRKNNRTETRRPPKLHSHQEEPIDHCYRALLETSSSAILLLSPGSIILGRSRGAETVSGWIIHEALGRSFVELCLPMEMRETFLTKLTQVTTGNAVKGLEIPLQPHTGPQTMLSWNISRGAGDSWGPD